MRAPIFIQCYSCRTVVFFYNKEKKIKKKEGLKKNVRLDFKRQHMSCDCIDAIHATFFGVGDHVGDIVANVVAMFFNCDNVWFGRCLLSVITICLYV